MSDTETLSPTLAILGFLAIAGSFGAGLAISYHHEAPVVETHDEAPPPPPEDLMKIYYPFPDDIYITMPDGTMIIVSLSFYLEAPAAELLALQEKAKTGQAEIKAALLEEAQLAAEQTPEIVAYRDKLPTVLKTAVNKKLGTESKAEPIAEVLLTRFMSR